MKWPIPDTTQNVASGDPEWDLLAELLFSELLPAHDPGIKPATGRLFQALREMGIAPEYVENIHLALTGFAQEAQVRFKQGDAELPGRLCVFCPKKMIAGAKSAKTERTDHIGQAQILHPSNGRMHGGWGYYAIERARDFGSIPGQEPGRVVELYIYQEGK